LFDYVCHCAHASQLATLIPPCLANSTCTPADLQSTLLHFRILPRPIGKGFELIYFVYS
jgi:hypothetical protein